MSQELEEAFHRSVVEGDARLSRTWPSLLATGAVGGIDVSIGILGLLVVEHETGSRLLGALAFGIGFIALTLANSELFTENFLVPVTSVAARRASPIAVLRLWLGTLVANLLGGWTMALLAGGESAVTTAAIIASAIIAGWIAANILAFLLLLWNSRRSRRTQ